MSVLQITPAERTALQMLADGLAHQDIASNLSVSDCVLDAELRTLFARMGVAGRNQAIAEAVRRGLVVTQRRCQEPREGVAVTGTWWRQFQHPRRRDDF